MLNKTVIHFGQSELISANTRYFACQVQGSFIKMDSITKSNATLSKRTFSTINQRLLILKHEIKVKNKILTPLLIKCIKKNIWPMLKYPKLIYELLELKQKYLSMLSLEYRFNSAIVNTQMTEWLCSLVLRIIAVETVYRSAGAKTPGLDGMLLNSKNLLSFMNNLTFQYLLKKYKPSAIKRVFLAKSDGGLRPIGVLTVNDRIVQTLFLSIIDPVLDPFVDTTNFGFRKGRSAHQAVGLLSKALHHKPKRNKNKSTRAYFVNTKHVLKIDIEQFFDKVDHFWLLNNYPFPTKFVHILKAWLKTDVSYHNSTETVTQGFPQGSVIGPSLANFTLNGLEKLVKPYQKTAFSQEKHNYKLKKFNVDYSKGNTNVRIQLTARIVRFADDFIIVTNDLKTVQIIRQKIKEFLVIRGLQINENKTLLLPWVHNAKFEFLGFIFHFILNTKQTNLATQYNKKKGHYVRTGLYVYPNKSNIANFKSKIKLICRNINRSPYKLISLINPIIRGWGNYFSVGTLSIFSSLDHFIFYRTWRYLRRKYKKVTVSRLIERFYSGVENKYKRAWLFHATWFGANPQTKKRRGSVIWLILLCKLNKPIPAHMFSPEKKLLNSCYYIDKLPFTEYSNNLVKLRNVGNLSNNWSLLYNKQKGFCTICKQPLGYLIDTNLEIHHTKSLAKAKNSKQIEMLNSIQNLELVHITCHKSTLSKN